MECLKRQTYTELEIILVDDGSTDGSGDLCDAWAAGDSRVSVIHQSNGGMSVARNAALDRVKGDFVTFIDSDDYVEPNYVERLLQVANDYDVDIAMCDWVEEEHGHPVVRKTVGNPKVSTYSGDEALKVVYYQETLTNSVCARMCRTSLFEGLRFKPGIYYEDLAITYDLIRKSRRIAFSHEVLYHYVHHPGSVITTFTAKRFHVIDVLSDLETRVERENPQLLPAVRSRYLSACFNMLRLAPHEEQYAAKLDHCWNEVKRLRRLCIGDGSMRVRNKLGILASYFGRTFLELCIRH